jgi:DNA gyrase subunit A
MGVRAMDLRNDDEIVSMQLTSQGEDLLFISEKGLGKRTKMDEFKNQNRGGKGVKCYKITEKSGDLVGAVGVNSDNEVMLITTEGIVIRTEVSTISELGRITSGVKVMDLKDGVRVASYTKVKNSEGGEEKDGAEDGSSAEDEMSDEDETGAEDEINAEDETSTEDEISDGDEISAEDETGADDEDNPEA